jgi:hypothetical protein
MSPSQPQIQKAKKKRCQGEGCQCMRPTLGAYAGGTTCAPQRRAGRERMRVPPPRLDGGMMGRPLGGTFASPPPRDVRARHDGPPIYKRRIRLRPFTSALTPGLQLLLSWDLR